MKVYINKEGNNILHFFKNFRICFILNSIFSLLKQIKNCTPAFFFQIQRLQLEHINIRLSGSKVALV